MLIGLVLPRLPMDQGRPKCICTESVLIRRLCTGEGVISNLPCEKGELPKGIQEGDEAAQMAELDDKWELMDSRDVASGMAATMAEADALVPTYEKDQSRSDWPKWEGAIQVELNNLKTARTWELVERPLNTNIVNSKWVFHIKKDVVGIILKWKTQLAAHGFAQVYGVDYCRE
jgi:hypothetical protein